MSSSLRYTFTKLRRRPCSLYKCGFNPAYFAVRSPSSSPMVTPSASTASCLPVNGRNGVGIRILFAISYTSFGRGNTATLRAFERIFAELRTIGGQPPDGHLLRLPLLNRNNHIPEERKRVIEIILGRARRMIGMRVVKSQKILLEPLRFLLHEFVI